MTDAYTFFQDDDQLFSDRILKSHSSGGHSGGGHSRGHAARHGRSSSSRPACKAPVCSGEKNCTFGCSCVSCKVMIPLVVCIPLMIIVGIPLLVWYIKRLKSRRRTFIRRPISRSLTPIDIGSVFRQQGVPGAQLNVEQKPIQEVVLNAQEVKIKQKPSDYTVALHSPQAAPVESVLEIGLPISGEDHGVHGTNTIPTLNLGSKTDFLAPDRTSSGNGRRDSRTGLLASSVELGSEVELIRSQNEFDNGARTPSPTDNSVRIVLSAHSIQADTKSEIPSRNLDH